MTEPLASPPPSLHANLLAKPVGTIQGSTAAGTGSGPSPQPGPPRMPDSPPQTSQRQALMMFSDPAHPQHKLAAKELFGRHFRGGLVVVPYEIKTRFIKQFYKRNFATLSMLMHALDNYRNIRSVDEALLDRSEAELADGLENSLETLKQFREQAQAMVAQQGASDLPIRYPLGVMLHVPIISPTARSYMAVLCAADEAFAAIERCWLLGLIDIRDRRAQERRLRQTIHLVSTVIRRCRTDVADHVRSIVPQATPPSMRVHIVTNPETTVSPDSMDHHHTGLLSGRAATPIQAPPSLSPSPPPSTSAPAPATAPHPLPAAFSPIPDAA